MFTVAPQVGITSPPPGEFWLVIPLLKLEDIELMPFCKVPGL